MEIEQIKRKIVAIGHRETKGSWTALSSIHMLLQKVRKGLIHRNELASDAHRVENEKRIVAEPINETYL